MAFSERCYSPSFRILLSVWRQWIKKGIYLLAIDSWRPWSTKVIDVHVTTTFVGSAPLISNYNIAIDYQALKKIHFNGNWGIIMVE